MENNSKIYLAILNITSWVGVSSNATHLYGHLILSTEKKVNIGNVDEYNVNHLGEKIELFKEMTLSDAKKLDNKDKSFGRNQRHWRNGDKKTNRFDNFDEVVKAGVKKWKELDIESDFISLYEGEKYHTNKYDISETIILQYGESL